MTTNESIKQMAASLMRDHTKTGSFLVTLEPAEDLDRVAIELQQLGCRIKRHRRGNGFTAFISVVDKPAA
jgi:hypothetical protein